jgi:hypothetical protein
MATMLHLPDARFALTTRGLTDKPAFVEVSRA